VHTIDAFVKFAQQQADMGADSIAIKDMAGIMTPADARELTDALVKKVKLPVQLHSHMTSGMATAMYLEGVKAGAGCVDTAISTVSSFSSQPPTETMVAILEAEGFDTGIDHSLLAEINGYFRSLKDKREPASRSFEPVDAGVLEHKIPGGMISNLRSQLAQQDALDRLDEVMKELPQTRADMGYPPLVTPTSQIVGTQAVFNVLVGRYKTFPNNSKAVLRGEYGKLPGEVNEEIRKLAIGDEEVITCRPADLLEPELEKYKAELGDRARSEEDVLSYALLPQVAMKYFDWRDEQERKANEPEPAPVPEKTAAPVDPNAVRELYVEDISI
jgi:oxaloacetate decarboxylase alpha subunit